MNTFFESNDFSYLFNNHDYFDDLLYAPLMNCPTPTLFHSGISSPVTEDTFTDAIPEKAKARLRRRRASCNDVPYVKQAFFEKEQYYKCTQNGCQQTFKRLENLKRHVRYIHSESRPHPCNFLGCGKSFKRSDNLTQHKRIHKVKDAVLLSIFHGNEFIMFDL